MQISVVLCTRNRAAQLARALDSMLQLRFDGEWELVVVDNGSEDDTRVILEQFAPRCPHRIVTVFEARGGLGHARNAGLAAARGSIVAFTDDDCYPAVDWLEQVAALFAQHPHLGYAGGRLALFDPLDLPVSIQESPQPRWLPPRAFVPPGLLPGANMAFRRDALRAAGGFDPRFGAGARFPAEDVDAQARMSANGWWGHYAPSLVVHHHHGRRDPADAERLELSYDRGRGAYYMKCVLNRALRWVALKNWYWEVRHQPAGRTSRELWASLLFLQSETAAYLNGSRRLARSPS